MSYYDTFLKYKDFAFEKAFSAVRAEDAQRAIEADKAGISEFIALLSPAAEPHLEEMAQKAHLLTLRHFGKTIQLYTPLYLSNYCENQCVYCGFNCANPIERKKLSCAELKKEAEFISSSGLRHILILTGESRRESPVSYIRDCVKILRNYFDSIHIEIYPLSEEEYSLLVSDGVDGLTIYQEAYDRRVYASVHQSGPKQDYRFRLDAAERAASCGMRCINVGALLGLNNWRSETFFAALHAKYLQDKFPELEVGVSIPRLRPQGTGFKAPVSVDDKALTQIILALRIFLPRLGIALSTRERPVLRDNLIPLGVTWISAGSSTKVGGRTQKFPSEGQFEIEDRRGVEEIKSMLDKKGYQAVLKDWITL